MNQNWDRHFELQLLNKDGQGLNLTDFKVTFEMNWHNINAPRVGKFKIYNLSENTTNHIMGKVYDKIRVIAGYKGVASSVNKEQSDPALAEQRDGQNIGLIFSGDIRFAIAGRESPTDTFVVVQAIDGHDAFINAKINQPIAAGYTLEDEYNLLLKSLKDFGIESGFKPDFSLSQSPRGRVFYGMTRDYLDDIANQCDATWQFVDSRLDMVPRNRYLHQVAAIQLNSQTGLIGMPQQTMGTGVNVKCLINPNIRVNGLIDLKQSSISRAELTEENILASKERINSQVINGNITTVLPNSKQSSSRNNSSDKQLSSIATDGVYIVRSIKITGDTRGVSWYMDMVCEARGLAVPLSDKGKNKGAAAPS